MDDDTPLSEHEDERAPAPGGDDGTGSEAEGGSDKPPQPILSPAEIRVLGCLMEKELTTPEYYPMTLNSLAAACNQRSNRDPVMELDEATVEAGLDGLREKKLAFKIHLAGSRVPKFKHNGDDTLWLVSDTKALLTVLLLRGPQTCGQLRARTERLFSFRDLDHVKEIAEELVERTALPLVQALPPAPGGREGRYAHTLGGKIEGAGYAAPASAAAAPQVVPLEATGLTGRVHALETQLAEAKDEIASLRAAFDEFRRQFEA